MNDFTERNQYIEKGSRDERGKKKNAKKLKVDIKSNKRRSRHRMSSEYAMHGFGEIAIQK